MIEKTPKQRLNEYRLWLISILFLYTGMTGYRLYSYIKDDSWDGSPELLYFCLASYLSLVMFGFLVYNWKKHKDFIDRRFSTPVASDGHELLKNTRELDKMIYEETRRPSDVDLKT